MPAPHGSGVEAEGVGEVRVAVMAVLGWLAISGSLLAAKPAPVTLTVSPRVGASPLNVRATMVFGVELREELVCLHVEADWTDDSNDSGRSEHTCVPHDTKHSGSQTVMQVRGLTPGDYLFQAVIRPEKDNQERSALVKVVVR